MLRKVLTGLALWLSALGLAPLALGTGIPVVDSLLNSTAAVQLQQQITTATQNVAQTLKQIDQYAQQVRQYETQLMQYAQQIKDATLPVSQIWNQAQGTMRDMMGLVNQAQGSQMLAYLQQYKDLNGWLSSNGGYYNPAAIQQGYALQKSTNDTALQMAQAQRTALLNDVQRFQGLQSAAGSADGANKLLSYANQIAAEQTLQLMQMRALCNQILEEAAARDAALANRQALMDAATQKALSDHNSDMHFNALPREVVRTYVAYFRVKSSELRNHCVLCVRRSPPSAEQQTKADEAPEKRFSNRDSDFGFKPLPRFGEISYPKSEDVYAILIACCVLCFVPMPVLAAAGSGVENVAQFADSAQKIENLSRSRR